MLRRDLIKGIFGSALLLCTRLAYSRPPEADKASAILQLFSEPASAANIGRMYLKNNPCEQDAACLTERIFADWSQEQRNHALPRQAVLKEMLAAQCRQDFRADRVSSIDGWVLSHTEQRLYAVAYLAS